ncbi:MAG: hypothetical protein AABX47_03240 [Nanoarchaeota archaeon]
MGKIEAAVLDAGPLIHLNEAGTLSALGVISKRCVTPEVADETRDPSPLKLVRIIPLDAPRKDYSKLLMERDEIDLGEATSIALCRKERIRLFFTDDLDARDCAKREGLSANGTLAIILRNLREGLMSQEQTMQTLDNLHNLSSLYITSDLISYAKKEITRWSKGKR